MAAVARHAGQVTDEGELRLTDPVAWRAAVARHKGRPVWVTVTRQQHSRTMPQNKYYWGVVVDSIADYTGEDRATIHEFLKRQFIGDRDVELLDGQHLTMPARTSLLSIEEFSAYVERVRVWAAQFLGLSIPDANQVEATL